MDPRYNWPPQPYSNNQYVPYAPPQPPPPQQPHGYQQNGYPPQYPPMQMPQGYPQSQPYQGYSQVALPRPSTQPYQHMPPQAYAPQQPRPRAQPQVVIPARPPNAAMPMQMQAPPRIRHVQVPVQRTSNAGIAQADGAAGQHRPPRAHQVATSSSSKAVQRPHALQENGPRPQQRTNAPPAQNQTQHRPPLQPQSIPQQRAPSLSQASSAQNRRPAVQQPSSTPKTHPQVVIPRPSSHQLTPTKHAHTPQKALPADLSVMLLSAADEYIAAARGMGSLIVRDRKDADLRQYYKLMATAMGCMEAVLKDFSMLPRDEAKLRLRYASLLVEETDNTSDIDEMLSKQISLCGRCRLQDLKYATLHLQARYQFKTNHRAALKSLDKTISEAETFEHIAWVYAFRFLKVSLILQIPGRVEVVPAVQQLNAIMTHAMRRGDRAVTGACSALEALVHLRSAAADRLEQAQHAIAAARSVQSQVPAKELASFGTLINMVDLVCEIQHGTPRVQKSTILIRSVLQDSNEALGHDNGGFNVLIETSTESNLTLDTGGVFGKSLDGRDELVFAWLPKDDLRTLCFHICALDQNIHEKGLKFIKESHQRSRGALKRETGYGIPISLALAHTNWNLVLDWHSIFVMGLIAIFQEDQATVKQALTILRKRIAKPPYDNQETYNRTLSYFSALSDQATGFLNSSLTVYSSDVLALPEKGAVTSAKTDTSILAALNRLLIVRNQAHPQHYTANAIMAQLRPLCENHPNQYIKMAFRIVNAISSEDAAICRQKTLTQTASNYANEILRSTQNREFVTMALCYFTMRFFAGQVGERPIQAIRATKQNAKVYRKPLWMAVAYGLCISTYQQNGLIEEAQRAQMDFEAVRPQLPSALRGDEDVDAEGDEDVDAEGDEDTEGDPHEI